MTLYIYRDEFLCFHNHKLLAIWNHNYDKLASPGYFDKETTVKL